MAIKKPLCNYSGTIEELQSSDSLPGGFTLSRVNKTQADSPVTLAAADCTGTKTFTNTGATAEVLLNLPAGADGYRITGIVTAAYALSFVANGTETIRYQNVATKGGGKITSSRLDNAVQLDWNGAAWVATLSGLGWQLETS